MGAAIFIAIFGAGLGLIFHADARVRKKRRELLSVLARLFGVTEPPKGAMSISGPREGHEVTFRLSYHGSGKSRRPYTEIDAPIPLGNFSLELRWQNFYELRKVKRGLAVDLITGDQAFDDAFIVEAAPADVALHLLTPELRRDLLALRPSRVKPVGGALRIERHGHVLDPGEATALCDLAGRLAAGLRPAQAAADAALEAAVPTFGGPFRPEPDASEISAKKAARVDEVVALAQVKERRAARERAIGVAIIVAAIVAFAIIMSAR